jgi:hypothetical protein
MSQATKKTSESKVKEGLSILIAFCKVKDCDECRDTYSGQQTAAVWVPLIAPHAAVYPIGQNGAFVKNAVGWYPDGKHSEATLDVAWSIFGNNS